MVKDNGADASKVKMIELNFPQWLRRSKRDGRSGDTSRAFLSAAAENVRLLGDPSRPSPVRFCYVA